MKVSVIIPTLNESKVLGRTLRAIGEGAEVIVADGGSTDDTRGVARDHGAMVVQTRPGRGLQMDAGSALASGEVLVFLHADTLLPPGWLGSVSGALSEREVVGGGFSLRVDSAKRRFRLLEFFANARSTLFFVLYGDQAIFARKDVFFRVGGFRKLPLMEDVDCVKRLRGAGRVVVLRDHVTTSPRKWLKNGIVRNTACNWLVLALYYLGVPPDRLYSLYYR